MHNHWWTPKRLDGDLKLDIDCVHQTKAHTHTHTHVRIIYVHTLPYTRTTHILEYTFEHAHGWSQGDKKMQGLHFAGYTHSHTHTHTHTHKTILLCIYSNLLMADLRAIRRCRGCILQCVRYAANSTLRTASSLNRSLRGCSCVCMYVCMHVCMYVYLYAANSTLRTASSLNRSLRECSCACICMHVCMYVSVYV